MEQAVQTMTDRPKKLPVDMPKPPDPKDEIFRRNLKRFREEAEISQSAAAELAGIPVYNLTRYESGATASVPVAVLRELAKAYGHTMDDFFEADPPPARLAERPVWFLRTLPGVDVDHEYREWDKRIRDIIDKANRDVRGKKKK